MPVVIGVENTKISSCISLFVILAAREYLAAALSLKGVGKQQENTKDCHERRNLYVLLDIIGSFHGPGPEGGVLQ